MLDSALTLIDGGRLYYRGEDAIELVALARALRMPAGAPLAMFAVGRTVGWIAQAIEQYADERLIRPRARYVGVMPG